MRWWVAGSNLLMIILLLTSNGSLLHYLAKKERIMTEKLGSVTVFQNERIKLILIALVFVISYAIDIAYDFVFYNNSIDYRDMVYKEIYYIQDPIPILILLLFHWSNFRLVSVQNAQVSSIDDKSIPNEEN